MFVSGDYVFRRGRRETSYGFVTHAGTKTFIVEWQDGTRTRVRQAGPRTGVKMVSVDETEHAVVALGREGE
jgi:hypothetical protein